MNPYALAAKLGGLLLVLALPFWGGCHMQKAHDTAKLQKSEAKRIAAVTALGHAADALRGSASQFRLITAQTEANVKAAESAKAQAQRLAAQAIKDRDASQKRIGQLETDLLAERAGCSDAERKICGVPLQ